MTFIIDNLQTIYYNKYLHAAKSLRAAETAAGANAYAVRDSVDDAWSAKYSCTIGDDTFNITITREYMLISGFSNDTTLETIETWADTIEEFGGEAA